MGDYSKEIEVDATLDNLDTVIGFVEEALGEAGCPMKIIMKVLVSLEEVYVNVANYAYGNELGKCWVSLDINSTETGGMARIKVRDKGQAFNPMEKENPDITLSADERPIGGLGIFMVKNIVDSIEYEYLSGENVLTMEKQW